MRKGTTRVSFGVSQQLSWPHLCVLCLKPAAKEDFLVIGGGRVPYCDACHARVQRLRSWKDGIFMIALIIGVLGAVGGAISVGVQQGWLELLRVQSWLTAGAAGLVFMGAAYVVLWLLILPVRLILHSRMARPGVKILKSKDPAVTVIRFSSPEYADIFREANHLSIPGRRAR